jgi:hypothetical protein
MNVRRKIGALAGAAALTAGLGVAFVGSPAQAAWLDCPQSAPVSGGLTNYYNLCVWTSASAGGGGTVKPAELINDNPTGTAPTISTIPAFYGDQADLTNSTTHPGWTNAVSAYNRRLVNSYLYYGTNYNGSALTLTINSAVADLTPTVWWHHVQSVDLA